MEKVENKWKSEETICYIWNQQKVNIKNSFKLLKQKWLSNRKMGKGHGKLMKSTGYVREGKKEKNKRRKGGGGAGGKKEEREINDQLLPKKKDSELYWLFPQK